MSQPTVPQASGASTPEAQSPGKPSPAAPPFAPGAQGAPPALPPAAGLDIRQCLLDAILAGFIALIVFGPVVGVVLDGYSFNFHAPRLLWIILAVMAGRFALSLFLQTGPGLRFQQRFNGDSGGVYVRPVNYRSRLRWVIPLILVLAALFPVIATKYLLTVAILGLIYVLLGLGLNIVVGLAGLLDLGYVAFYAIGAYGLALGYQYLGLGFWSMLPLAAIMAAAAGALLGFPVLRMHGDYLAIVTLGFGEIIRLILNNWLAFTGGPNGVSVPSPTVFGLEFGRRAREGGVPIHEFLNIPYNPNLKFIFIYGMLILVVLLVLYIKHRLTRMPIGRAWEALREDEIACRAMGLNHVLVKLSAFTLGASTAGIAGVFFATYQGFVNPTSFSFFESALILAIVVLGGMGSTIGVVIAAFVLTVAPELLRSFAEYRVLLFGILMVVMMIWRPRGLIRISRAGFPTRKGVAP
ncbi:high-affinity branched-chain amino acid ABC transporter permease LivM [Acerihabitans sp.]|uniref:high-affinity branched-chain amino acid ABC transporter permease LivM n=1 Tax=Acerihabitans sp. TaxID=2811394 RepID=UPI002ED922D3